jgi:hypothetical protein
MYPIPFVGGLTPTIVRVSRGTVYADTEFLYGFDAVYTFVASLRETLEIFGVREYHADTAYRTVSDF